MTPLEQYKVFKFFKDTYVKVKCAEKIKIFPDMTILLEGCKNNEYFILQGKILEENEFFKYLKNTNMGVEITSEQWTRLGKCLKKNIRDLTATKCDTDLIFFASFKFINDNEEEDEIILDLKPLDVFPEFKKSESLVLINSLISPVKVDITENTKEEIIELFIDDSGKISKEKTSKKLIEVPTDRVLSIIGNPVYCRFSNDLPSDQHYVGISSTLSNKSNNLLELEQIFATL